MGEGVAKYYYLWFMWQSSNTAGEQLWEDETVCIFRPRRVIIQIWTVKIWQCEASDHLEKPIMCNLFQLIWKPTISSEEPPSVSSEWIDILQILLIRLTRA